MKNEEKLLADFIRMINVQPGNDKKLFLLGFIGLNGVGKSYVAEKIAKRLNLYVANNDSIRRFLNKNGFEGASPAQQLVQKIAESSTKYLFENNISHIIDADLIEFFGIAQKNADEYGAKLFIIHLICPEEIILKRLEDRNLEIKNNSTSNLSRVGTERYFERKKMHESMPLPKIFFTINTSDDVDSQVDDLIEKLKKEKAI